MLTRIRNLVGLILILVASFFLFKPFFMTNGEWDLPSFGMKFHEFWMDFTHFNLFWLLPALVIYLFGYVIRGYRWVVLLAPIKKCSFKSLFPTLLIGFMANNITPLRLGEFYRAHLNGQKEGISRSASLGTIILERLFDGMAMLVVLGISLSLRHPASTAFSQNIEGTATKASYFFGAAFLGFFAMLLFKKKTIQLINYFISHAPQKHHKTLERICHTFLDGLQILQNIKESFLVLTTSLAAWTCEFTAFYLMATGFGLTPEPIHLNSAALLMVIINLGLMIPSTPGGLGIFEGVGVTVLSVYAIPYHLAFAYTLTVHMLVFIPITLLGYYSLRHEGLTLKTIEKEERKEEKELS